LILELNRYFGEWIFHDWAGGLLFSRLLSVQHVVFGAVVMWGCFQEAAEERLVAIFTASLAMAYAFLVGQKAANYLSALAPFFALAGAGWLQRDGLPLSNLQAPRDTAAAIRAGLRWSGVSVLVAAGTGAVLLAASICFYQPTFSTLARRFSNRLPAGARIAGPEALWIGMSSYDYRDIGAIVWHRLLLNEKNLWRPLENWQPEYLILEDEMGRRLAQLARRPHQPVMRGPTGILPWSHEVLDVLRTGPAYGETMVLVHIDWPPKRASR
jgi:hypothetical protein